MISPARLLLLLCLLLAGCGTAKKAAVTTFRVVDAPARYVRDRIDPPVTTIQSDVVNPGHPIAASTPPPAPPTAPRVVTTRSGSSDPGAQRPVRSTGGTTAASRPAASGTPRPVATTDFPTARPVPGRPGFVYSLDPNGGIVDVNGYKSGDKAKDPYTKQIFVVP